MNVSQSYIASNISATTAAFTLNGGRYVMAAHATWGGGNITLQLLCPDGSTFVSVKDIGGSANTLTADGSQTMDCPPGQYRITVTTASAIYASIASVPT